MAGWATTVALLSAALAIAPAATAQPAQPASHAFLITSSTGPVHYPSCAGPISWSLAPDGIAESGSTIHAETMLWLGIFTELEAATEYRFAPLPPDQPATITIHYTDKPANLGLPTTSLELGTAGLGGITAITWSGSHWVAARSAVIMIPNALRSWHFDPSLRHWVARHELGHALGLGHVADRAQIMSPRYQPGVSPVRFGPGDFGTLHQLGILSCPHNA